MHAPFLTMPPPPESCPLSVIKPPTDIKRPMKNIFPLWAGRLLHLRGIYDGDIVIMRPHKDVQNGDLVAVWLADKEETTLKRIYKEGSRIRLQPANPTMQPIYIENAASVEVQGRVVAVIRRPN